MIGEITKAFGSAFLLAYFAPVLVLVFAHPFWRYLTASREMTNSAFSSALHSVSKLPLTDLGGLVLVASIGSILLQLLQVPLTKVYEGYHRTTLTKIGGAVLAVSATVLAI